MASRPRVRFRGFAQVRVGNPLEITPIRKRETELNPRRGSARLRANRFAPLQTVDRPKPGKFTRSRRPAGRVRVQARPSFALLDRAFPGPRTKREGRTLLTENWQDWNWQQFHIGNIGRVLPVCECCQSPGPIANASRRLPSAFRAGFVGIVVGVDVVDRPDRQSRR